MRQQITWQLPDHLYFHRNRKARRFVFVFFGRLFVISTVASVLGVLLLRWLYPNLPPRIERILIFVILLMPGFWLIGYVMQQILWLLQRRWKGMRPSYTICSGGVHVSDSVRSWKRFVAFDIEPYPELPGDRVIMFYSKEGFHISKPLPGNELDDTIIRFVAKHLPLLDEHSDPELVKRELMQPPDWLLWTFGALNVGYGIALGYLFRNPLSGPPMPPVVLVCMFVNPATLGGLIGWWTGWFARRHYSALGWWLAFSMMAFLSSIIGALFIP